MVMQLMLSLSGHSRLSQMVHSAINADTVAVRLDRFRFPGAGSTYQSPASSCNGCDSVIESQMAEQRA